MIRFFLKILIPICFLLVLLLTNKAYPLDRCQDFTTEVRSEHIKQFGYSFPWATGMGVMKQESACRPDAMSFDGGIGLYQFTPSTGILKSLEKQTGFKFNPSNPVQSIHAFVLYIQQIINSLKKETSKVSTHIVHPKAYTEKCELKLAAVFTSYNGGFWFVWEWEKGGKNCNWDHVKSFCTRGGAKVGNRYLSFCDINYSYAKQVANYAKKYGPIENNIWKYW